MEEREKGDIERREGLVEDGRHVRESEMEACMIWVGDVILTLHLKVQKWRVLSKIVWGAN